MNLSVLFVAGENLSGRSGGPVATVAVSNALCRQAGDFRRIALRSKDVPHRLEGETTWIPSSRIPFLRLSVNERRLLRTTIEAVRARRPDRVVVRIGPTTLSTQRWLLSKGIPTIGLARGIVRPEQATKAIAKLRMIYERERVRRGLAACDSVFCAYHEIAEIATASRGGGDGVHVLSNAVDSAHFQPLDLSEQVRTRRRYGVPEDAFVVGFAGSLQERHCLRTLLEAIAIARRAIPNLQVVLIGEGPLRKSLQTLAGELGMAGIIHFIGFLDRDRIGAAVGMCDVLYGVVHPEFKSNPIKCYEYLAARKYLITSKIPDFDFMDELGCGIRISALTDESVAAAIVESRSMDREARDAGTQRGRDYVLRHHTWDGFARTLLAAGRREEFTL